MTVNPGDIIVGDGDGVIAIPPQHLKAAMDNAQARMDKEAAFRQQLAAGRTMYELLNLQPLMDGAGIEIRPGTWRDEA